MQTGRSADESMISEQLRPHYAAKGDGYFCDARGDLAGLIPGRDHIVLEVGCGAGATGRMLLSSGKAKWVTGIEIVPAQAARAAKRLSEVIEGDICNCLQRLPARGYDCIILGDILEHLVDPWAVVRELRWLIPKDGLIIASVPNIRNLKILADLLIHDEWKYYHDGILDVTHLRFFTKKSAKRMFTESGFVIDTVVPRFAGRRFSYGSIVSCGLLAGLLAERWLIRATPKGDSPATSGASRSGSA